jgi:uncharacterized membrane protein
LKFKLLNGILIVDILAILLVFSIFLIPSTLVRVILGLPFLLFFPGYTLTAALFVKKELKDNITRLALGCGMSVAVTALIGFCLNYTPWGVRLEPVVYIITIFIIIMSSIALIRRAYTQKRKNFISEYNINLQGWGGSPLNKFLSFIFIVTLFSMIGILGYTVAMPKIGERFTDFYIIGKDGQSQDYPKQYSINNGQITEVIYSDGTIDTFNKEGQITLGIINHENQTVIYSIKMTIDNEPASIAFGQNNIDILGPIELQQEEKWEKSIGIVPQHIGSNQKVELLLYIGSKNVPEYNLHFWINVK